MTSQQIVSQRDDITLTSQSSTQFCQVWPSVKQGLQLLATLVKNPIGKGAIELAIAAGDAVSAKICGPVKS